PQPFALMDGKQEVPYQLDDLNGDGQPDEAFALVNFRPTEKKEGSTLTLTVQAVASSEVEAKTQAFLLRQPHTYDPDSVKKLTGDYQRIQEYDVPDNLKPQGYWLKFEGPSWENDVVGYRVYMDTRNRYDIFGKQVSDLVMDTVALDYHKINPWGADILKVGNSLGIGSPALLVGDSLMAFENYAAKRFELVTSGPLRSIFRIHFTQLAFGDDRMDLMVEHEMHAGHRWTEIRIHVLKTTIKNPTFATGLVKHPAAPDFEVEQYKNQHIGYTYGAQSFHDEVLGMAIIVPDNQDVQAVPGGLLDSHVFTFSAVNGVASYRFLAAWEREPGALTDEAAFAKHLRAEATAWE
ncbi:MAG: DUF4861 family protein, partial [Bacteroidota bacterium]